MPYAGMPPDLILRAPCPPDVCPAPAPQPGDGCRRSCPLPGPAAGCSGAGPARDRRQGPAPSQSPGFIAKPAVSPASLAAKKVRFVQPSNQSAGRSISGSSAGHNLRHAQRAGTAPIGRHIPMKAGHLFRNPAAVRSALTGAFGQLRPGKMRHMHMLPRQILWIPQKQSCFFKDFIQRCD